MSLCDAFADPWHVSKSIRKRIAKIITRFLAQQRKKKKQKRGKTNKKRRAQKEKDKYLESVLLFHHFDTKVVKSGDIPFSLKLKNQYKSGFLLKPFYLMCPFYKN
ncbi:hypothetical protein M0811_07812 [Anaeramoeba ignava]|uniref:Uncharacterized protein n=1 Tax=Anaeramoeba ignava TaxID=1746090 RepID=A0A9Q0LLH9_ANAIG|nr:hypothetical protein M0811_07812 [Anaeramoeba ignava]